MMKISKNFYSLVIKSFLVAFMLCSTLGQAAELVGKPAPSNENHSSIAAAEVQTAVNEIVHAAVPTDIDQEDIHRIMDNMGKGLKSDIGNDDAGAAILIPIIAILMIFGGPLVLVIVLVSFHYRSKARRQEAINNNIDKLLAAGRDIPIELLRGDEFGVEAEYVNLQRGLRNLGLGIGLLIFLTILFGIHIGAVGFIFMGLGASRVLIWFMTRGKTVATKVQD